MYIFPVNYVPSSKEELSETSMPETERRLILSKLHTCAYTWKYYIKKLQKWSNVLRFDHVIKSELFRYQFIQIYEYVIIICNNIFIKTICLSYIHLYVYVFLCTCYLTYF